MALGFPFTIDARGRSAEAEGDAHVRDMIEAVLFTLPGERVNRPDFGCGLLQLVFAPNSDALSAALNMTIQSALQQWLSDLIEVDAIAVESDDACLRISVGYVVRRTREQRVSTFSRSLA